MSKGDVSKTSLSFLSGLRASEPEAWNRLVHLYGPLVLNWCRKFGLHIEDASDIVQEVFRTVFQRIKAFRKRSEHPEFRSWLQSIFRNKFGDYLRSLEKVPRGNGGNLSDRFAEVAADERIEDETSAATAAVYRRAFDLIRSEFEEKSWQAFWLVVCENRKSTEVARELRMSLNAVYLAKSRILHRLRETLGDATDT